MWAIGVGTQVPIGDATSCGVVVTPCERLHEATQRLAGERSIRALTQIGLEPLRRRAVVAALERHAAERKGSRSGVGRSGEARSHRAIRSLRARWVACVAGCVSQRDDVRARASR